MSKLQIDNTDFMVTSLINRCPNTMMIRELIKNAMEAALCASLKNIVIGALDEDGTRKLHIWNTGPGMGPAQLRKACGHGFRTISMKSYSFVCY
jgi:sensor histidine kinase regulating citrate/malate metabolism